MANSKTYCGKKKKKKNVFKCFVMITSDHRGKRETNVGDGGEKSALEMEESQEGKNSNSGGKESINTGNYS